MMRVYEKRCDVRWLFPVLCHGILRVICALIASYSYNAKLLELINLFLQIMWTQKFSLVSY